ncbi:hypothetical protein COCSUDRAFT_68325 [Coccomyxa subellipsoidea C-169]|uniref:Uncharacterized protein n=1 Tax=Coccomyxa subellipsoidea (strain C-169) TaxID=574566 RepID=I0YJ30_COCSC|nr:hypothetical protein COCSUDRAFT_68325 [Coccomyxa subellipsoidea C-169]EIE18399.1 hypothetical protein COCSUDRAFT_68325 [Coccomyxa subellipsoidea C-169]|eukprot:XP_005642943.1 hypothetical protein COCSUDRAFT_68325 [Coccomyxa subellipsoidea C-169]
MQVLQENAQLRERLAKTKAALSYSEALLSSGEVPQPPLASVPPAVAASAAARRPADSPAQPEKRQKIC